MGSLRHTVLTAIAEETRARRGPMPPRLVPIASNCRTEADRNAVEALLITLHTEGLIQHTRDAIRGNGLMLTEAGQRARQLPPARREPAPTPPVPPKPAASSSVPSPTPPPEPETPADSLPAPERIDPECQPELAALLCDLAGVLTERLSTARLAGDVADMTRYRDLANRLQRHLGAD
ncbi:hypothetical protein FZZ93_02505 [Halomonas eurihalina]|uniref:Uncharacterized protein n=1 Tax=Halomonas eurihalina TaxID=42566 RepID=A0A5D9DE60_HALER|nr:hypothetical protein [Halomonas eurihalina]MDR5857934.1 hypothetical protein [Halomonas eurihalina]TZG41552.1 hypothetical protein FZZ93_02505 [Halomonas eurihalina]